MPDRSVSHAPGPEVVEGRRSPLCDVVVGRRCGGSLAVGVGGEEGKLAGEGLAAAWFAVAEEVCLANKETALGRHAPGPQLALADSEPHVTLGDAEVEGGLF